jgi:hypothetical protein
MPSQIYKEYQQLIGLYNDYPALRKGSMLAWPNDDILLFEKKDGDEQFLVAVNVRNQQKSIGLPDSWSQREVTDMMTEKSVKLEDQLSLEPFQYLILR